MADWTLENPNDDQSIASMVTSVAMEAYAQNDYEYIPRLELYYQQQSGYFYKQGVNDFYHAASQYAYHFDSATNEYQWIYDPNWPEKIGCEIDLDVFLLISNLIDRIEKIETGEIESDSDNEIDYPDDYKKYLQLKAQEDEIEPCIRLIDRKSDIFSIVTIQGATIGFNHNCDVQLCTDTKSEQVICSISFDPESKTYSLMLNSSSSSNNVSLNGYILAGDQENFNLNHRDTLEIEPHCFDLHIHKGLNTCAECEPGLKHLAPCSSGNQIVHLSKSQKEKLRRKELKELKSQYGLTNDAFMNQPYTSEQKYVDRANIRRKVVGSDHQMTTNCKPIESASITKPISDKNVGFKMLSKMGWKEGQSLGSKEQNPAALNEPLLPIVRVGMSGLGSENSTVMPNSNNEDVAAKKLKIIKMKQRYDKTKLINFFDDENT